MYVILTSKPGQFRTEPTPGLVPVEAYDYMFHETRKARFVIAAITGTPRIRVVEEGEGGAVNSVPCKFLQHFETIEQARRELHSLTAFGSVRSRLDPVAA
jgi:hypothetical protein